MQVLNIFICVIVAIVFVLIISISIYKFVNKVKDNTMYKNVTTLLEDISSKMKNDLNFEKEIKEEKEVAKAKTQKIKKKKKETTLFDELDINFNLNDEDENVNLNSNDLFKLKRISKKNNAQELYDFKMILPNKILFIKIIPNYSNAEICMNNATKWQIRKSFNDTKENYIEIDEFVRFDAQKETKDIKACKLALVYPNANAILRYVNECEMKFVTPKTDLNGLFVMTYQDLKTNYNDIKCEGKKI